MKTVIHTNQTEKGQSTVKLINSVNSNQKKLRIGIIYLLIREIIQ